MKHQHFSDSHILFKHFPKIGCLFFRGPYGVSLASFLLHPEFKFIFRSFHFHFQSTEIVSREFAFLNWTEFFKVHFYFSFITNSTKVIYENIILIKLIKRTKEIRWLPERRNWWRDISICFSKKLKFFYFWLFCKKKKNFKKKNYLYYTFWAAA